MGTGIAQVSRGVLNSPAAAIASMEGMDWDEDKREWILYNLDTDSKAVLLLDEDAFIKQLEAEYRASYDEQVALILEARAAALLKAQAKGKDEDGGESAGNAHAPSASSAQKPAAEKERPAKQVRDSSLYDVLGVSPDASASQLKRAYFMQARKNHPDRCPGDPDANSRFQTIGDAYNVLSNEQSRRVYDEQGRDAVSGDAAAAMDPRAFFAMVFGTEDFEPLIGELQLAAQFRLGMASVDDAAKAAEKERGEEGDKDKEQEEAGGHEEIPPFSMDNVQGFGSDYQRRLMGFLQTQRQVRCAVSLASKLQAYLDSFSNYTEGDAQGFEMSSIAEAEELAKSPLGAVLVSLIGNAYVEWARAETDLLNKVAVGAKQAVRNIYTKASIGYTGAKSLASAITPSADNVRNKLRSSFTGWFGGSSEPAAEVVVEEEERGDAAGDAKVEETPAPETETETAGGEQEEQEEQEAGSKAEAEIDEAKAISLSPEEEKDLRERADYAMSNVSIIAWRFVELDIRSTVAKICRKVTHDHSVDDLSRRRRVEALAIRGHAFIRHGKEFSKVDEIYTILKGMSGMAPPSEAAGASAEGEQTE